MISLYTCLIGMVIGLDMQSCVELWLFPEIDAVAGFWKREQNAWGRCGYDFVKEGAPTWIVKIWRA